MKITYQILSVLIVSLSVTTYNQASPRYESKVRIPNQVSPDAALTDFIDGLRKIAVVRDLSEIEESVRNDFFFSRDFGGVFDAESTGADNFIRALSLDDASLAPEYRGTGWVYLNELLSARSFQKVASSICMPANAVPVSQKRPDEFWLSWGYVHGTDVFIRRSPDLQSEPLASLSYEVVEPVAGEAGDRVKGLDGNGLWIKVNTASGIKGYMYSSFFRNFQQAQLCFRQQNNVWKISGFIGGGD